MAGDECRAKSVLAVDFMPNLIAENERVNGHYPNASFAVGDATELQLPAGSVDVLFSNWLLMYLGDAEVASLARRSLSWVVPGGVVFFRESCFRQSGDKKRAKNPTHYRDPREYFAIFDAARGVAADGATRVRFELETCRCVDTYVRLKQNQNQLCWKWRVVLDDDEEERAPSAADNKKDNGAENANAPILAAAAPSSASAPNTSKCSTPADAPATPSRNNNLDSSSASSLSSLGSGSCSCTTASNSACSTPRHFLDAEQYSSRSIARYERVFGRGFVTSGGEASTRALLPLLSPALQGKNGKPPLVLDLGSGLGGAAAILAADYGARVRGVDLSVNMVLSAMDRHNAAAAAEDGGAGARAAAALARFEVGDATRVELRESSFDAVHSRDTLLHIEDKAVVLKKAFDALRPGGMILLTDYLCAAPSENNDVENNNVDEEEENDFAAYVSKRKYHLWDLETYRKALADAGFEGVVAEDRTGAFERCLTEELERAAAGRDEFVRDFSEADYDEVVGGWKAKLARVARGQQRWGLFVARKPL